MIPTKGANPEINAIYIGAFILNVLNGKRGRKMKIVSLMKMSQKELSISIDHIILTLDWLYVISAIDYKSNEVLINETN
ncbi:hypothetical protein I6F48_00235 [Pseudoalteromonas sp. SWYJ118]|uniref:ABC-three component system middle component 6 n=1 Tax=Pseudoalteromonas sp. SWYJ118 TaxID=2792062 RepID=UPI0018CC97D9|nr:ABC-three component system middle component 6 [Pseudoalteromonas sp. SWYJ118]MBH0073991.1 hypothetical protein [Pseudoalteromonas sp. SWYJ118]